MKRSWTAQHVPVLSAVVAAAGLAASVSAQTVLSGRSQSGTAAQAAPANGVLKSTPVDPAAPKTMIVLIDFSGVVQVRRPNAEKWEIVRESMVLPEGTEVRTGQDVKDRPRNWAVIQIGPTQKITVDKMTQMTIRAAANDAGTERTRIELPRGRLGIDVDSTRIANDVQIVTPETTLAVKGTTFFIEHTSAFGTIARGAETNTGTFNVVYLTGAVATVTGTQETSSTTPDPAVAQQEKAQIDTADPNARETDELAVAQRAAGSGEAIGLSLGISPSATDLVTSKPINNDPPAAIANFIGFDQGTGTVFETDLSGGARRTLIEGVSISPGAPFSGLSLIEQSGGARTLYLLRSELQPGTTGEVARNRLYSADLGGVAPAFGPGVELGGNGKVLLLGLGSLGDRLFANGFDLNRSGPVDSVYEITPSTGSVRPTMALPGVQIGGSGGSNERGSMFLAGRLDLLDGSDQHVFLEVDPRTNYFIGATGGSYEDMVPTAGTVVGAGIDASTIDNISGLAVIDGILVMSATALVGDKVTNVVVQYDPAAANTASSPRLRRVEVEADAAFVSALASERGILPRGSRELSDPPGPIDLTTINRVFAQMSYGDAALATNVLERMVGNEIINTARDPAGCAASGALDALPSILRKHVDKTSGIGRSVAEFRESLPFMHPCGHDHQ